MLFFCSFDSLTEHLDEVHEVVLDFHYCVPMYVIILFNNPQYKDSSNDVIDLTMEEDSDSDSPEVSNWSSGNSNDRVTIRSDRTNMNSDDSTGSSDESKSSSAESTINSDDDFSDVQLIKYV